ncbi:probable RNA-directed DNA polymerase from transposon X-element [Trichonephila clavipes]|nr:probable RNA-directed DNA polymerase from transposon X-element [Trichonephila clavipes]
MALAPITTKLTHSTNWSNFKFALNKKPLPITDLTSNEIIEFAISELNQNFSEAFVEASKPKFKNVPKILSPEIKSKIHQRNRLRKFWQRTRCPSIYSEFRTLSREIANDIKSHSQAQWEKHIKVFRPRTTLFGGNPPYYAEVIADSLQEHFEPNHVADREEFDQRIHEEVANFLATPHVQEIEPTTPTEVLTYVQRIKPKKSPGLDQITNHSWKTAVVIPILKPDKNPELAQNYRPISLLSCLSKVYEFVLLQRLNQHCAAANFIIPQQCGFRPKCSTVHQLLRVTELIHSGFAKHEATGILFLDIAKAFDKIWHDGLLIKLIRLDFPAPLIKSIHSFLSHRSFRMRVDRILSYPRPIRSGLRQGSLSSPLITRIHILPRDTAMSGHEDKRASRVDDAKKLGMENPAAHAIEISSADAHCAQIKNLEKLSKIKERRIKYLQDLIEIETFDKDTVDADQLAALIKEKATTELEYATTMGELKVLFPCPAKSCNHSKANGINSLRNKNKRPAESPILPATLVLEKNPKVQYTKNNKNEKTAKNPAKKKQDQKTVVDPIIPTNNSFASLVLDDAADPQDESPMVEDISETTGNGEDKLDEDVTVPPKIKPIMLKYKDNYNMVLKGLNRMYPNSTNKLTGKYIKIMASTTDEHREITNLLKSKGEEFYAVPALADRPLKVVIKGLPKSTATAEIKADLLEQGVPVMKVSQLTQRKSKFPLPIFLVEVRKHVEGATDIYDVSKCCYMSVVLDTFKKRPGATQCYNCNFFNHSSVNCFIKPRCLKCSKEHRTGECPIKERLDTPHCINCDVDGHTANWRSCPAFPKIKAKKGAATENRNKVAPKTFTSKKANANLSYANAASNSQQMAGHLSRKTSRRRIAILSPFRIKKRKTPLPKDLFRQWPNFANFFRTFQAL